MGTFEGRAALVTGGGSGIGRATAVALAESGAGVVVCGRRADALDRTADLHPNIRGMPGDVTSATDVERVVKATVDAFGRIDVLVNNAGATAPTPLGSIEEDTARTLWATNVLGPTLFAQAALPELTKSAGVIINVTSSFGHRAAPGASHYGASKAALEQLTRSWALELAGQRVRVNAIAPGPIESEALDRTGLPAEQIERIKDQERHRIPLGRRGEPEDVARWIVALAEPAAGWVTGQVLDVDGGFSLS